MSDTEDMIALAIMHNEGVAMRRENRALAARVKALEAVAEAARALVEAEYSTGAEPRQWAAIRAALAALKGAGDG